MTVRGGPQIIPRPPGAKPGRPAPWAGLKGSPALDLDRLRRTFGGRIGAPSVVEGLGPERPGIGAGRNETVLPSAVLACFWEHDGSLELLLTRRSGNLRSHRGEVAFPGGRAEPDEALVDAAIREAQEEVGLDPATVVVLGELDHLTTISSRSFIVPFVATLPARPEGLVANADEVDTILYVPVAELLLDEVYREERWTWPSPPAWSEGGAAVERPIFFFELVGDTLWGATAAMVRQLLALALGVPTGIDHA